MREGIYNAQLDTQCVLHRTRPLPVLSWSSPSYLLQENMPQYCCKARPISDKAISTSDSPIRRNHGGSPQSYSRASESTFCLACTPNCTPPFSEPSSSVATRLQNTWGCSNETFNITYLYSILINYYNGSLTVELSQR